MPIDTMRMFGDNNAIFGGTFTIAPNNAEVHPFELLQRCVATTAFHNSSRRVDPPKCHPETRIGILQKIYDWIIKSEQREEWLLWLNGAAGVGKSAIVQSIVERCVQESMNIASFFFLRSDSTRNTMAPLIATLAYQLIQAIPETSGAILLEIKHNPLIFEQSIELQLQLLILQPLLRLLDHLKKLFAVFIDGLDECIDHVDQSNLLKVLGGISSDSNVPIVFLVASRREPQIDTAFSQKPLATILHTLSLDEISARDDIIRFLDKKFEDVKETHLYKELLTPDWPPISAIRDIIAMCGDHFIVASIVINYISLPRANPATQLEVIRGIRMRDPSSQNPFAHLDALYHHIFSQVETLEKVLDIIAFDLIAKEDSINLIERTFMLEAGEVHLLFSDLMAVILCEPRTRKYPRLKFLHASVCDFLLDKSRSGRYHIDLHEYRTKLLCMLLERSPPRLDPLWSTDNLNVKMVQERMRLYSIILLLDKAKASDQIRSALMNFDYTFSGLEFIDDGANSLYSDIIHYVELLDFGDQGEAHYHIKDVLDKSNANQSSRLRHTEHRFLF